jgi:hypothetical protein
MKRATWVAILLLPAWASADSQLASSPNRGTSHASARVDFKIVIPNVLYLGLGETATIATNGRSVTFTSGSGSRIATATRRQVIVEHTQCSYATTGTTATCTVATP